MDCKQGLKIKIALAVVMSVLVPIVVARAESRPDAWITMKVKAALEVTEGIRASAVGVDTSNGCVTLHGKVRSEKEKAAAAHVVRNVAGIVQVRNLLQVVAPSNEARVRRSEALDVVAAASTTGHVGIPSGVAPSVRHDPTDTEDDAIRRGVERALRDLDSPANADIHVRVKDGIVWLTGSVPAWQGNDARVSATRSVNGVRSIVNSLRVDAPDVETR